MDGDDGTVGDIFQGVLHRVETGEATGDQPLGTVEVPVPAIPAPPGHVTLRENGDHPDVRTGLQELFDGALQHGASPQGEELFGQGRAHPGTGSAGRYDEVFFSLHSSNFFMRM